ncbi:unnamed protein product [Macrosiphum euphorbiae]|uniref:Uncharacterized protein n=1 Tax=Macrosiphum euphorbiae TaxID=13131 RepID=A0AAV0WB61_9HEMI|nr:unnamed protein product [Macrosiphum euphorbiae]
MSDVNILFVNFEIPTVRSVMIMTIYWCSHTTPQKNQKKTNQIDDGDNDMFEPAYHLTENTKNTNLIGS